MPGFKTELPQILGAAKVAINQISASKAGVVILGLQVQSYREGVEATVLATRDKELQSLGREYFSMLAVALALVGKRSEGRRYLEKARTLSGESGYFGKLCKDVHYTTR